MERSVIIFLIDFDINRCMADLDHLVLLFVQFHPERIFQFVDAFAGYGRDEHHRKIQFL